MDSRGSKEPCNRWGPGSAHGKGHFGRSYLGMPRHGSRYSPAYLLVKDVGYCDRCSVVSLCMSAGHKGGSSHAAYGD